MESPTTPQEEVFANAASLPKSEKLSLLLKNEVRKEQLRQRSLDEALDHPIALFTRQKNRSARVISLTLLLLTIIHGIQIIALYNFNVLSGYLTNDNINDYIERRYWVSSTNNVSIEDAALLYDEVRLLIGGSEVYVYNVLTSLGFCLSSNGFLVALFNVVVGLFFIYLFIFADMWKVMFATIITRNFPSDPNFKLCLSGAFWLVCLNSAILAWLGVEAGFSVVASHGDFYTVLFNSMSIFIILKLDETVLPLVRFLVEDLGHLNDQGELSDERLKLLTHGTQYHKPGYGQRWIRNMTTGHPALRVVAVLNAFVASAIIVAPLAVTINYAVNTLAKC